MSNTTVLIKVNETFTEPIPLIYGAIIVAPQVIPYNQPYSVFFSNGDVKDIILIGEMMSLEKAWQHNLHGFGYKGDIIEAADYANDMVFVSNIPYHEAIAIYQASQKNV